jgi:transcriptional regulator with XRE-family HTH domain
VDRQRSQSDKMAAMTEARTDLSDLVRERRAELGISLVKLEERSIDPEGEGQVKSSWLHRLERGMPVIAPNLPQLRALAAGLDTPLRMLQDAAGAQFFGIEPRYSESGAVRALVSRWEAMTPAEQAQLQAIIEAFDASRPGQGRKG